MEYFKLISPTIFKEWTGKRLHKQSSFVTSIKDTIETFVFSPNGKYWEIGDYPAPEQYLTENLLELYTGYYWDARLITYIREYCIIRRYDHDIIVQEWSGEEFWQKFIKTHLKQ